MKVISCSYALLNKPIGLVLGTG
uniref:Uncharacterized protein n=1 Tax=Anguilla anguilla TaxID=7936 RepID=A0A0E9V358_ANGAN